MSWILNNAATSIAQDCRESLIDYFSYMTKEESEEELLERSWHCFIKTEVAQMLELIIPNPYGPICSIVTYLETEAINQISPEDIEGHIGTRAND